jgi:hypothetical protein
MVELARPLLAAGGRHDATRHAGGRGGQGQGAGEVGSFARRWAGTGKELLAPELQGGEGCAASRCSFHAGTPPWPSCSSERVDCGAPLLPACSPGSPAGRANKDGRGRRGAPERGRRRGAGGRTAPAGGGAEVRGGREKGNR